MREDNHDYDQMKIEAKEVFVNKESMKTMTICELTAIYKLHELKSDDKLPRKKKDLIEAWNSWKNRPPPIFEHDNTVSVTSDNNDVVTTVDDEK